MKFRFTTHAKEKLTRLKIYKFHITAQQVKKTVRVPLRNENRGDGTEVAMTILDTKHVLRVVYRQEHDIIVIITLYPGRRKAYGL